MRARALPVAIALAAPACEVVFPLTYDPPEPTFVVEGQMARRFVVNDASLLPALEPIPYTDQELAATAVLEDGREVAVDWNYATGEFSFLRATPDQPYRLVLTYLAEQRVTEYQTDVAQLALADTGFGRPGQVPATSGTSITGTINNVPWANGSFSLRAFVTGTWKSLDLPVNLTTLRYDALWSAPLSHVEPAKFDKLYFAVYMQTGPARLLVGIAPVDNPVIDGVNMIDGDSMAPGPPGCIHLTAQRAPELARVQASYPTFPSSATGWFVGAFPAPERGLDGGITLTASVDEQQDLDVGYNQAFPGMKPFVAMGAALSRMLPNGLVLAVGASRFAEAAVDCPTSPERILLPSGTVPIASRIALDGESLDDEDAHAIVLGAAVHDLTWEIDTSDADLYVVNLFDVTDKVRFSTNTWFTTERHIRIDPAVIKPNRTYVFEITSEVGVPNAATGDFSTISYPVSLSTGLSMTFAPVP